MVLHVLHDGNSASNAVSVTSVTNIEDLAGTDNVMTFINDLNTALTNVGAGGTPPAYHSVWLGRALNTTAPVVTGANSGADDIYIRMYEFADVSTGTTLASVIENNQGTGSFAGKWGWAAETSTTVADVVVETLGPDRLALNFVAINDDAMGLNAFTGESGGTWALATSIYETATGTDGTLGLMSASMPSAATINGGSDTITSAGWGVIGFALIGTTAATAYAPPFLAQVRPTIYQL
jgi:hypothetical protein